MRRLATMVFVGALPLLPLVLPSCTSDDNGATNPAGGDDAAPDVHARETGTSTVDASEDRAETGDRRDADAVDANDDASDAADAPVESDAGDAQADAASGDATPPSSLAAAPSSLTFAPRFCNGTAGTPVTFTLTNPSAAAHTWTAALDPRPYFTITPSSGSLAPGESATITVTPSTLAPGNVPSGESDLRRITVTDDSQGSLAVAIHESIAGAFVQAGPTTVDFGRISRGSTVAGIDIAYSIFPQLGAPPFYATLTSSDAAFTVTPRSTLAGLVDTISFVGTAVGTYQATLSWSNDALCNQDMSITATATVWIADGAGCNPSDTLPGYTPCGSPGNVCWLGYQCLPQLTMVPAPFSVTSGVSYSGVVAHVNDYANGPFAHPAATTGTVDWGDGATSPVTFVRATDPNYLVYYDIESAHTYSSSGPFSVTVTVRDSNTGNNAATTFMTTP